MALVQGVPRARFVWRAGLPAAVAVASTLFAGCAAYHGGPSPQAGGTAASRFAGEWARAVDSPELRARLTSSPLAFFRFVNQAWTQAVCEAFATEYGRLPLARLHGDAHIEQYAVTDGARGLDDFDDSARGPAVVDIIRFLASLELAAGQRGWTSSLPAAVDAFFAGYRRALVDRSYLPPDPAVATRLRTVTVKSVTEFLTWADALMSPPSAIEAKSLEVSWPIVERLAAETNPEFTPAFLTRKRVGWIRLGIGSALTPKLLFRIEGPSPALEDDLVIEAKEVRAFTGESCVTIPISSEAFRAVEGIEQIGRLQQRLLVALPGLVSPRPEGRGWWVKAWDRTLREVTVDGLDSPTELRELAHDVGAQLGATNLVRRSGSPAEEDRHVELEAVARLEARVRRVAHDLTVGLIHAWEQGRHQKSQH